MEVPNDQLVYSTTHTSTTHYRRKVRGNDTSDGKTRKKA